MRQWIVIRGGTKLHLHSCERWRNGRAHTMLSMKKWKRLIRCDVFRGRYRSCNFYFYVMLRLRSGVMGQDFFLFFPNVACEYLLRDFRISFLRVFIFVQIMKTIQNMKNWNCRRFVRFTFYKWNVGITWNLCLILDSLVSNCGIIDLIFLQTYEKCYYECVYCHWNRGLWGSERS